MGSGSGCSCGLQRETCIKECTFDGLCKGSSASDHYPKEEQTVTETSTLPETFTLVESSYDVAFNGRSGEVCYSRDGVTEAITSQLRYHDMDYGLDIRIDARPGCVAYLDPGKVTGYGRRHLLILPWHLYPKRNKITAIKLVRKLTELGLKETKDLVEREKPLVFGPFSMPMAALIRDYVGRTYQDQQLALYTLGEKLPEAKDYLVVTLDGTILD